MVRRNRKLRSTMPLKRFKPFVGTARFDDKSTRSARQQNDKLAAIREMFNSFVDKCCTLYEPSPFVCIDETLVSFRGRCPFRVYIPSKPDRYGIKVWCLCDCGTNYVSNMQVYLGKQGNSPEQKQGERVVKDLSVRLFGSGRNVTTDNFFTSYNLAQFLLTKNLHYLVQSEKTEKKYRVNWYQVSVQNMSRCLHLQGVILAEKEQDCLAVVDNA